ncbi:MAG: histidine kinase [Thermoleophilia bacterium]
MAGRGPAARPSRGSLALAPGPDDTPSPAASGRRAPLRPVAGAAASGSLLLGAVGIGLWAADVGTAGAAVLVAAVALALVSLGALAREERRRVAALTGRLEREAADRDAERALLTERLITAEQDERRRLALFLHDGPLQSLSGIALMHDAAVAAIGDGKAEDATRILVSALARERQTIQALRDLSFAIEPIVLLDHGLAAAVRELADQLERDGRLRVDVDVAEAERLGEKPQVALYQLLREALWQASRRSPALIVVTARRPADGSLAGAVVDDGVEERRRANADALAERARILGGPLAVDALSDGGTRVRVELPAYLLRAA